MCICDRASAPLTACSTSGTANVYKYTNHTAAAAYQQRDGAALHYFNGKYWLLGGWWTPLPNSWSATNYVTNEVWSSLDLVTWTLELSHVETPPTSGVGARWNPRHTFMSGVLNGYMWVWGSDQYAPGTYPIPSDVWRTSDGTTWERVAASSPWGSGDGLYNPGWGVYNGYLHVIGGHKGSLPTSYLDWPAVATHWRSSDGVNWEQLPDMPFVSAVTQNAPVLCGAMFVIGGNAGTSATRNLKSHTWAYKNGIWYQQSASSKGVWSARDYISTAAFDNKLWVLTGYNGTANDGGAFWSKDLGDTWNRCPTPTYAVSHADAVVVANSKITIAAGNGQSKGVNSIEVGP